MTKQEMFDQAARGILAQGGASYLGGICKYRGAGGRKCAAGHLIPDEAYAATFEGMSCAPLTEDEKMMRMRDYEDEEQYADRLEKTAKRARLIQTLKNLGVDVAFARELQNAHDDSVMVWGRNRHNDEIFIAEWKTRMQELAKRNGLSAAVLEVQS